MGTHSIDGVIIQSNDWRKTWGTPSITVALQDDLALKLDADTFTQVNAEANRLMLAELLNAGAFDKQDRVLELYSGAGNFTLPIARQAGEITAVEGFRTAVASGKLNGQRNGYRQHPLDMRASAPGVIATQTAAPKLFQDRPRPAAQRRQGN